MQPLFFQRPSTDIKKFSFLLVAIGLRQVWSCWGHQCTLSPLCVCVCVWSLLLWCWNWNRHRVRFRTSARVLLCIVWGQWQNLEWLLELLDWHQRKKRIYWDYSLLTSTLGNATPVSNADRMAVQNKNLSSTSFLVILQALLSVKGIIRNKFSVALLKAQTPDQISNCIPLKATQWCKLCSNTFRKDLKVCAENSISHLIDSAVLSKELWFVPLQKTIHLHLIGTIWRGKNNVVETRTFLKVLYLEVSGISFINDKMHVFWCWNCDDLQSLILLYFSVNSDFFEVVNIFSKNIVDICNMYVCANKSCFKKFEFVSFCSQYTGI